MSYKVDHQDWCEQAQGCCQVKLLDESCDCGASDAQHAIDSRDRQLAAIRSELNWIIDTNVLGSSLHREARRLRRIMNETT